ncbi:Hypothetical protein NTJ_15194 [Nesidiocoris tenuis]|uniref:Uncharacterized protein n=1 Tax=Nesidiocoris tenuis TaxID=355587 RepID=A0ABN7BFD4_9HEMI|nr:Hypothetical protein NTJ_15194 [Nesidiocoris tenuis]
MCLRKIELGKIQNPNPHAVSKFSIEFAERIFQIRGAFYKFCTTPFFKFGTKFSARLRPRSRPSGWCGGPSLYSRAEQQLGSGSSVQSRSLVPERRAGDEAVAGPVVGRQQREREPAGDLRLFTASAIPLALTGHICGGTFDFHRAGLE